MGHRANRLARELSPYLLQHAQNPVDWYPWGEEAFARARAENKPILLSIGYSACHWCHVMERESFEDEAIAARMNADFVNIKVDREERPDVDAIYMNTVQMLTGAGGWPLTAFLTPEGKPFYGGTYFPPEDRYGRPGFPRVLEAVARAYRETPDQVAKATEQLVDSLARLSRFDAKPEARAEETVARGAQKLLDVHDSVHGGIGSAPKFPNAPAFLLFLRRHQKTGDERALAAFDLTLTRMAQGGMYDHLGGGFHRYSVDAEWLVPHFEKMLYDSVQLVCLYADGFVATGNALYRSVVVETLDYLLREMQHPDGGFYSSQDADTEGEEGKTYLWRLEEIEKLLDAETAEVVARYYQVDEVGNFAEPGHTERKSILHVKLSVDQVARLFRKQPDEVEALLAKGRSILLRARDGRPQPGRDDKVLTSWNALAIRACVRGANTLGEGKYLDAARRAALFLDRNLRDQYGRLLRTWREGEARYPAYLDDYAFLAAAHLDLFEATGTPADLARARELCETVLAEFWDSEQGGFFFTAAGHESLIDRPKIAFDASLPSGNAIAAETLLRLAYLLGDDRYREHAEKTLSLFGAIMESQPFGTASLLIVLDDYLRGPTDVVIVGPRDDARTRALVRAAHGTYVPGRFVMSVDPSDPAPILPPAAQGKVQFEGRPVAYVCRSFTCSLPVADPKALADMLSERPAG